MRTTLIIAALLATACGGADPKQYRFGDNISGLRFEIFDADEGIHPSKVVLDNKRNPFRFEAIGEKTKFDILTDGGNAGGFYAWATLLARVPTGEHQFYTAQKLADVFDSNELGHPALQKAVNEMSLRAYQSVLDNFPDSVSFDATGTISFRLATPAYKAIVKRGGKVGGNWVLITTPDGREEAVQGGSNLLPEETTP